MSTAPYDSGGMCRGVSVWWRVSNWLRVAPAVIAWLRERGFRLSGVYNMAYDGDGRAVQAEFLCGRCPCNGKVMGPGTACRPRDEGV